MKFLVILLIAFAIQVNASVYSQNKLLSVDATNKSIREILSALEHSSDIKFFFNEDFVNVDAPVSLSVSDRRIDEILDELFSETAIGYRILENNMVVLTTKESLQQQKVTGTITDAETGEPLPGVNIQVKGTMQGAVSDAAGRYNLVVDDNNATLIFSFIGYIPQEIQVAGQLQIDVSMEVNVKELDEVVVVGYGTVKKRDVTGAVASVKGDQISSTPVANAAQALTGKLAGVSVVSQDGRPDASISIRVRGGGSISQSNDPLFIVDGFPVSSISDIASEQIESIDVLKDASSTAIYGARGANGVIIVTTKTGQSGKLKVTYDCYAQFNQPTKYLETLNAYDYIAYNWGYAQAISDAYANAWEMLWAIGDYADDYGNTEGIDYYKNVSTTNYSKEAYGNSFSQSHNLTISNGNEKTKYLFSVNYIDNDGMKVNSWYKRANASFKLDQKLSEKLTLNFDTRFSYIDKMGDESTTNGKGSILSSSYQFRPIATSDVLGELDDGVNTQIGMYDQVLQDRYNPVARMKDYSPEEKDRTLRTNLALSWNVIRGLTARSEIGLTTYWKKSYKWWGAIYNDYYDSEGNKTYGGNARLRSTEGWSLRWANTLSYDVQGLGENHLVNLMAGHEVSNSGSSYIDIWGNQYPASFDAERAFAMMDQYNTESTTTTYGYSSNSGTPSRLISYFGRINYSLLDRYLITATFRTDGSSRFSPTHRWGYFPAAAVAWRLSEESFMKDIGWLSNLKVRVSYGAVGNDGISADLWRNSWSSDGKTYYSINEEQQQAYSPASTIANPNLKWETTITRNLGFDFAVLNGRIYGTLDLYKNSTRDLLMKTSVSTITGFSYTYENIGSTSNKGIEFSLGGDIIRKHNFKLNASFNININRGKVEELAKGVTGLYNSYWGSSMTQPSTGDYILVEGKAVGQVRGYQYDGWYTVDDFDYDNGMYTLKEGVPDIADGILGTVYGTTSNKPSGQTAYPGVMKFRNIAAGDDETTAVVDENDIDIIGDMNPKHTGGFNINASYKNIDFALSFNWSYGNKIYNANYIAALYGSKEDGLFRNRLDIVANSYKIFDIQDGQLVSITDPDELNALNANASMILPYQENPVCSTLGIHDGSFLRLNTVTLGYTLPHELTNKVRMNKLRIYGTIFNALIFTNYKGLDPEVNSDENLNSATYPTLGLDWGAYPRARSFTIGLNIEF